MKENKQFNKPVIAVSLSLALVLVLVIALFITGQSERNENKIQLPESSVGAANNNPQQGSAQDALLQVDKQNVIAAIASLKHPEHYHQLYTVEVGSGADVFTTTVDLWVRGTLRHAQITSMHRTKTVLSNGSNVWIWYSSNLSPAQFELSSDVTFEDILGLPAFDYLATLESATISEAEYLIVDEDANDTSCIFISAETPDSLDVRYWISLETGTLYESDCMEDDVQVYHVKQSAFDLLAEEDEAFLDKFLLPDGSVIPTA